MGPRRNERYGVDADRPKKSLSRSRLHLRFKKIRDRSLCCDKSSPEPPSIAPQPHQLVRSIPDAQHTEKAPASEQEFPSTSPIYYPHRPPSDSDFLYDIAVSTSGQQRIRRVLTVDFRTDSNVMSVNVCKRLNETPAHCDPATRLHVAGMGEVAPLGTLDVNWTFWGDSTVYQTEFYVVERCRFDMLLGRPSVTAHGLSQKDPAVGTRLQMSSYQQP